MVYLALTRGGYEALVQKNGRTPSPLRVGRDVLSVDEQAALRVSSIDLTVFSYPISPSDVVAIESAVSTIKEHHPNESVWVEYLA